MASPVLVLGLGNPLAGDDGIGARVVAALAADARLPQGVEVMQGGSDLLRLTDALSGRLHVVLIDAILDPDRPGAVDVMTSTQALNQHQGHAHHLSAVQSLALLRAVYPELARASMTWVAIAVGGARITHDISPELEAALPDILDRVLAILQELRADLAP
jgi:hydrogenase maturation protease